MRVLLAASTADKEDRQRDVDTHLSTLELARSRRCDIAVFPEFSLTGSVDPTPHPQRAVSTDSDLVAEPVVATGRLGVAAVFGIAARTDERFYIAQLHAEQGELRGR